MSAQTILLWLTLAAAVIGAFFPWVQPDPNSKLERGFWICVAIIFYVLSQLIK